MKKSDNTSGTEENNILVVYFSRSGNTHVIATQIHESVGGDIFEIVTVDPYPSGYDEVVEQARKELTEEYRPKLKTKVENIESYNIVFVGYPNWWSTVPRPIATFLSEYDFSGKTMYLFAHTREAVWDKALRISRSFARSQLFLMVLQSAAETLKMRRMRYLADCVKLE